jgi:hypothetical protein
MRDLQCYWGTRGDTEGDAGGIGNDFGDDWFENAEGGDTTGIGDTEENTR